MKLKNLGKLMLLSLSAIVLVVATVLGTLAYFTDRDTVVNTFTVGKVSIRLDEGKVNEDGYTVDHSVRVKSNKYFLIPGRTVEKDPVLTVEAKSESSWLFVKISNELTAIEGSPTIESQLAANGWTKLAGTSDVYYKSHTKTNSSKAYPIFETFTVSNLASADQIESYADKTITITAYAIQKDGFTSVTAAWAEVGN